MMKRTLSLLVALIMVVGLLPNTLVFAADANDDIYIDESSSLEELEDLGIVDVVIPEEDNGPGLDEFLWEEYIPEEDNGPDSDGSFGEEGLLADPGVWDSENSDDILGALEDTPELSPPPKVPENVEENVPTSGDAQIPVGDDDGRVDGEEVLSGSLSGTFTSDMTVSHATTNQGMVWKANATGADVDQSGAKIDIYGGYPYYNVDTATDYTIQILPDEEDAAAEGVTQLHVNLYQIQIRGKANLRIYLDPVEFAKYPKVTEVVIHSTEPGRDLVTVIGGSLTLEGLADCRLVLDGGKSDGTSTANNLLSLGSGNGVGSVNVNYVTFRNSDGSAIDARGGLMGSVSISNCYFESTCRNNTMHGGAICFFPYYSDDTITASTAVETLTVSNCTFDHNSAYRQGGAVCLSGAFDQVEISDSTFTGTSVTKNDWRGGALALVGFYNEVTVSGNTFTDCTAASYGGAIGIRATIGKLTVSSDFINCRARSGGAIDLSTGELSMDSFKFLTASCYARINTLNIDGSHFSDCSSDSYRGGAINISTQIRAVSVTNSSFTNCSASAASNGGGICFGYTDDLPSDVSWSSETWLDMTGLEVESHAGGGVWSGTRSTTIDGKASIVTTMGSATVENTTFDGCKGAYGGGIYLQNASSIDAFLLKDVEVKNCQATVGNGGGIGFASTATGKSITITNVKIHDNASARNGGGLYINGTEGSTVSISGSQVYGNIAGASRDSSGSIVASRTSGFCGDGGGIYLTGSSATTVTVSDSVIGTKLQDTENGDGEAVQTPVSAPNFAYFYVKDTVVTEATDDEPAQIEREYGGGGRGGGLYVSGVKLELKNTKVLNNEADHTAGGIAVYSGAILSTDSNTDVSYNTAPRGGGIYTSASAVPDDQYALEMIGSTVSHNRSYQSELLQGMGGGIYMGYTKAKLVGVTVSDNICANVVDGEYVFSGENLDGLYGGGIAVYNQSTLEFYGGSILRNQTSEGAGIALYTGSHVDLKPDENGVGVQVKDNIADSAGGGVCVMSTYDGLSNSATIEGAIITGNKAGNGPFGGNGGGVYVSTGGTAEIINTQIGSNTAAVGYEVEKKDKKPVYVNGEPKWVLAENTDENADYVEGGTAPKEIYGYGGGVYCYRATVTIRGCDIHENYGGRRGGGLYSERGSVMYVYNIIAEDGSIAHRTKVWKNYTRDYAGGIGAVGYEEGGISASLTLEGTLVEGNYTEKQSGGGVYISSLAECTMDSGTVVKGNTAARSAGGVFANIRGVIRINGAQIIENTAGSSGGGVYVSSDSDVIINEGLIAHNTAQSGNGGGIVTGATSKYGGCRVILNKGSISDNVAYRNGGGVYATGYDNPDGEDDPALSSVVEINGGEITRNRANGVSETSGGLGGGIYVGVLSRVTIADGKIYDNDARSYGGGVMGSNGATVEVKGGEISQNRAEAGGGIHVGGSAKVYVKSGLIQNNTAQAVWNASSKKAEGGYGGGITASDDSEIIITGGSITENKARCVVCYKDANGKLSDTQDEVYKTMTREQGYGGGICAQRNTLVHILEDETGVSGEITKNQADTNGGGIFTVGTVEKGVAMSPRVIVDGGSIAENTALNGSGGGIYAGGSEIYKEASSASVTVNGGQIIKNKAPNGHGGGIYAVSYSATTVNDGGISQNEALRGGGIYTAGYAAVTMNGGEISNNTVIRSGGGLYTVGSSKVTLKGGSVKGNCATDSGGGIYAGANSTVTMSPSESGEGFGSITGNTATLAGGGVYATGRAQVTLTKGNIQSNTAKDGGGIYASGADGVHSTVTVDGGMIGGLLEDGSSGGNTANGGNGGGIYATSGAEVKLQKGNVTGNTAGQDGGGIYGGSDEGGGGKITLSGGAVEGNKAARNGGGIYAWGTETFGGAAVTLTGGLVKDNHAAESGGGIYAGANSTVAMSPSESGEGFGSITGNTATLAGGGVYATDTAQVKLTKGNIQSNTAKDGGGIYASGANGGHSTVIVDGGMIGGLLEDGSSGGNTADGGNGGGIYATSGAEVKLQKGNVTGNTAGQDGGGIYGGSDEGGGGKITLSGGTIEGNTAKNGGGIYVWGTTVYGGAEVTLTGGAVKGNTATTGNGGGIYATGESSSDPEGASEVYVNGGTIEGNTAKNGGGIYGTYCATVQVDKGEIIHNEASNGGGGMYVASGANATVSGGKINDNQALSTSTGGGGIYIGNRGTVTVSGGELNNNTADAYGGGIFVYHNATMNVTAGKITNNHAAKSGGGVFLYADNTTVPTMTVDGGEISGNVAQNGSGGGIYATGENSASVCRITVNQGLISNNESINGQGGGIALNQSSTCTINGGTITDNTATRVETSTGYGGGVYMGGIAKITVNGGTISWNEAYNGGGIYATGSEGVMCTVQGGEIIRNTASNNGGGIGGAGLADVLVQGGMISENTAVGDGGGIYIGSSSGRATVTITKTTVNGVNTVGTVKNNTADNGGGVYVSRGGELVVNEGHIINNTAVAPKNAKLADSGRGLSTSLHGAGGGICVASNDSGTAIFKLTGTPDEQTDKMNMAIYGNTATYSGDEVFSNGRNTSLTVPLVSQMNLEGYEFDIVGWFEDYNTGDTNYTSGLNMKAAPGHNRSEIPVKRYRNSTASDREEIEELYIDGIARDKEGKKIELTPDDPSTPDVNEAVYQMLPDGTQYVNLDNAYVAMALGIPAAFDDVVVVDYGMSVDIDLLSNDMLLMSEGEGMNPTTDSKLGLTLPEEVADEKEILYSRKLNANGQDIAADFKRYLTTNDQKPEISILNRGTAEWKKDGTEEIGVLRYSMKDMKMDTEEVFYYVVPGENFYYYAAVTVIPATTIYYEDNSGFITYHNTTDSQNPLAEWKPVPEATKNGAQDQDRPGMSAILEGLDADNIYGYDSSYATSSTYSGGSAYMVTVGQHKATDEMNFNNYCDVFDEAKGDYCRRKVTHTYQNNGFGKCSVCLNTEDRHSSDIPKHKCADGNNCNEYCDVCSRWIGLHTISARASFTFTGTGFDIVSLCSNTTGLALVNVFRGEVTDFYDPSIYNEDTYVMSYMVDTYYGYKYENGEWVVDPNADDTLYQVPVIKSDLTNVIWSPDDPDTDAYDPVYKNFGYGTYTVELVVGTSWTPGAPNYDTAEFYLDAIRIYNPVGISGSESEVAQDAYLSDGEAWPAYAELRDLFIEQGDLQDEKPMEGVLFIDGLETPTLDTYRAWGPNNEIYLNPGQSVSFTVDAENYGEDIAAIHLGVRGLTEKKGTVLIQAKDKNDSAAPVETILNRDVSTTDMYYDISNKVDGVLTIANKVVTITNACPVYELDENGNQVLDENGNPIRNKQPIAISNLKVTHNSEPGKRNGSDQSGTGEFTGYSINRMVRVDSQTARIALDILTPEQVTDPVVTPKRPALSFNGMVCYNVFFSAEELGDLTAADLGLAVFSTEDTDGTVETADEVHLGATEIDGLYMVATDGVHAKFMGDTKYFRAFAKKADGSYIYSKMVSYSAKDYAMNALAKSDDVALKQLVVAMLNYGTEAQKFFGYKVGDLMNKDLTADDLALLNGFNADSLNSAGKVDASKVGSFASTGGFTKKYPAISFKGAFEINYFFTPANAVDGDMKLYIWNEDTYNSVTELTAENADKAVAMTLENGTYTASSDEIAAKYLDKTVYVAAVYESEGVSYCSGVLPYSIAAYCRKPPAGVQDLATAAAIYGCTAKQYFGV